MKKYFNSLQTQLIKFILFYISIKDNENCATSAFLLNSKQHITDPAFHCNVSIGSLEKESQGLLK